MVGLEFPFTEQALQLREVAPEGTATKGLRCKLGA